MTNSPPEKATPFEYREPLPILALLFIGIPSLLLAAAFATWLVVWLMIGLQLVGQMPLAIAGFGVAVLVVVYRVFAFGQRMFSRRGVVVDREQGTVSVLGGLFVPSVVTTHPLSDFHRLRIRRIGQQAVDGKLQQLEMVSASEQLCLIDDLPYVVARDLGERIGSYLNWDLEDASPTFPVLLPASTLGKSLAELRGDRQTPRPEPPAEMVGKVEITGERIVYQIPPRGGWGCSLSFVVVTAVVASALISGYVFNPEKAGIIAFSVVVAIFWCVGLVTLLQETASTTVEIDPRSVRVRTARWLWTSSQNFPAENIREVRTELKTNLRLIATNGEARFGHSEWKDEEVTWLRDLITYTLQKA